jgi:hypothetical protein
VAQFKLTIVHFINILLHEKSEPSVVPNRFARLRTRNFNIGDQVIAMWESPIMPATRLMRVVLPSIRQKCFDLELIL